MRACYTLDGLISARHMIDYSGMGCFRPVTRTRLEMGCAKGRAVEWLNRRCMGAIDRVDVDLLDQQTLGIAMEILNQILKTIKEGLR